MRGELKSKMFRRLGKVAFLGIGLTLASALYAKEFNWPDYYHIEYGFPMAWLIRTLNTIIGPVDRFAFQPIPFLMDWLFWLLIAAAISVGGSRLLRPRAR
jgi:hypothetical protein